MDTKIIKFRTCDYEKCDYDGRSRLTLVHEGGHNVLHSKQFERNNMKMFRTTEDKIPAFKSSEWQANSWASATLMPLPAIVKFLVDKKIKIQDEKRIVNWLMKTFIVSKEAAKVRLKVVQKYQNKGKLKVIISEMKKRNII